MYERTSGGTLPKSVAKVGKAFRVAQSIFGRLKGAPTPSIRDADKFVFGWAWKPAKADGFET